MISLITFYPGVLFPCGAAVSPGLMLLLGRWGEGRSQRWGVGNARAAPSLLQSPSAANTSASSRPPPAPYTILSCAKDKVTTLFTALEALQLHHPAKQPPFYSQGRGDMAQRTACHRPGFGRAHQAPRSSRKPQHRIRREKQQVLEARQRCLRPGVQSSGPPAASR